MAHETGVLSRRVHRYSKLPLIALSFPLSPSPLWGSFTLDLEHLPMAREDFFAVLFTFGIFPPTGARQISETDN